MFSQSATRITKAVLLSAIIFLISIALLALLNLLGLEKTFDNYPWLEQGTFHSFYLILPMIAIFIMGKGDLRGYGFRKARNVKWSRIIFFGLVLGVFASLMGQWSGDKGFGHLLEKWSFLQIILIAWLWGPVCEEIFIRGLIQSYLAPLENIIVKFLRVNVPTLVSALIFGAFHITLMTVYSLKMVAFTVSWAFVVGLFAGHYRAQSQSLIPAIVLHILVNIGGTILMIIVILLGRFFI